jgi:hypothetical protein
MTYGTCGIWGSHSGVFEDVRVTCRLHLQGWRLSQARALLATYFILGLFSTLKLWTYSSETSVDFKHTTWSYIQEELKFHKDILEIDVKDSCISFK